MRSGRSKIFILLVLLVVVISICAVACAEALSSPASDFNYIISDGECTITKYYGNDVEVLVPREIKGCPVTCISSMVFAHNSQITSITIPNTVERIYDRAFFQCNNLKQISWEASITEIAAECFYGCSALTDIVIPNSITYIGVDAFYGCESLKNIVIPDSVVNIDGRAFNHCTDLANITIPSNVSKIGYAAFSYCNDNLTFNIEQGSYAETYARENNINISFYASDNTSADFSNEVPAVSPVSDFEYIISDGKCTIKKYIGSATDVVIPDKIEGYPVTAIGNEAFISRVTLRSIVIPEGVISIGNDAFNLCDILASVDLPESLVSIGERAFRECYALDSIVIPSSVISIGARAFECGIFSEVYLTICGERDSYAERYANENHIVFCEPQEFTIAEGDSWKTQPQNLVGAEFSLTLPDGYYLLNANTKDYLINDQEVYESFLEHQDKDMLDEVTESKKNYVMSTDGLLRIDFEIHDEAVDQSILWMMEDSFKSGVRTEMQNNGCTEIECGLYTYGRTPFLCAYGQGESFGSPTTYGHFITVDSKGKGVEFWTFHMDRARIERVLSSFSSPVKQISKAERTDNEEDLKAFLMEEAETDSVYMFNLGDYDGDGIREAFGFIGYDDDQGILHGDLWFVNKDEATLLLGNAHIQYLEMWGAAAPYYWAVTNAGEEDISHFWGVQDGTVVELDWDDYDPEKLAMKVPGEITNLQEGDVFTSDQDIEVKWNLVDGAGTYYVTAFYIDDAGEDYFWGDDIWGDRIYETYVIPAGTLPADEYRIQVSAWIGTGGHGDEELACDSVYVTVIEGETEDDTETDHGLGFITPEDGITIQAGQKLELEWTPIPEAQVYSIDVYPPSGFDNWWEAFYNGELSATIPRSTLIESSYQIELSAWKDDNLVGGNEIFQQTITVYVHDKFAEEETTTEETVADTNELHTSGDFVYLIQEDGTAAFAGFNGRGELRIPETIDGYKVTAISDGTCYWNSALESVHIPATVKTIGADAFAWCGFLKEVNIRPGVTSIGDRAFMFSDMVYIELPDTITHMGERVLSGCNSLLYVDLPQQLASMGESVFAECEMLKEITIPSGVKVVPKDAFFLCPNLETVCLPDGLEEIGEMAFYACGELHTATIPETVKNIGAWAFSGCGKLTNYSIPENTVLAEGAFMGCP